MLKSASIFLIALTLSGAAHAGGLGLGRAATAGEIIAWDIDVRPDGQGLPEGRGTVAGGEEIFLERCAACHGDFGEGLDRWPQLAGGSDTLASEDPVKTVSSYWPYLSTVYDYIYRAMPFGDAQSLTPDETYAVVAYILYMGDVIEDQDFELSKDNFTSIKLPNQDGFVEDARPDMMNLKTAAPCMSNCKDDVEITATATILDVTPDEEYNPSAATN